MTRIAVVGLGYIGLPTAIVLARAGAEVIGVDVS
ncbi:UDP-N-acetyl-D-mannosamine dehydrogenase [Actinomyces howellii]|uniref:UDP-N-acetyl-D-mannosamine dehydrogenase n=1 Tax=Actinomyces howellii TaxID=52771 RepID=A0A448HKP8_9ACTO|nr:UDP-N-acetyl-D-mannosamine dehydrogenase [Actinomyces howellii]